MRLALAALPALALVLTACDGGGDPVQQALRETAEKNQSATLRETATTSATEHAGHAGGATPGDQAFAASETSMHAKMAAASGETIDQAYVAKMIAHHEGAVEMAEVALKDSRDPDIRRMAQAVVDTQTREIAEMRAWRPGAED